MIFTLEALQARHGDSLILHYGPASKPKFVLIDGGPDTVYEQSLRPRLEELRETWHPGERLPIQMLMVSHIDDDHIVGVLALTSELVDKKENKKPLPYDIQTLWFNSFNDVLGDG